MPASFIAHMYSMNVKVSSRGPTHVDVWQGIRRIQKISGSSDWTSLLDLLTASLLVDDTEKPANRVMMKKTMSAAFETLCSSELVAPLLDEALQIPCYADVFTPLGMVKLVKGVDHRVSSHLRLLIA